MGENLTAMRYTKECIRTVRDMNEADAREYLRAKMDALPNDPEKGRQNGMKQFLDDKSFRPGLGQYNRQKAAKEAKK